MRDEDKPFVCTRGRWTFNIRPRNAAGWLAMAWWVAALLLASGLHAWMLARVQDDPVAPAITIVFVTFVLGWTFAMIRWMLPRSVIVTPGERPGNGRRK